MEPDSEEYLTVWINPVWTPAAWFSDTHRGAISVDDSIPGLFGFVITLCSGCFKY